MAIIALFGSQIACCRLCPVVLGWFGLGWIEVGWVTLGWVGLGWVRLDSAEWIGLATVVNV